MKWMFLILLILFELIADIFAKEFSISNKIIMGIISIFFFIVCNIFWLYSLKNGIQLYKGAAIFAISTTIGCLIIGTLFYSEEIKIKEIIGILLGILSIYLILK